MPFLHLLSFIFYISALSLSLADAQSYFCNGGTLNSVTVNVNAVGTFLGSSCSFLNLVSISGEPLPVGSGTPAVIQVSSSTVSGTGCLQVIGPTLSNAPTRVPFRVSITSNTFGLNAGFRFLGSLPPASWIIFEKNTLSATLKNAYTGMTGDWIAMVSFSAAATINLYADSYIAIQDNTFAATASAVSMLPIVFTSISLYANSAVRVLRNRITASETSSTVETFGIHFAFSGNVASAPQTEITFVGSYSSFIIDGNSFTLTTSGNGAKFLIAPGSFTTSSGLVGTLFAFRNNVGQFTTETEYVFSAIDIRGSVIMNEVQISNNVIKATNNAYLSFTGISILPNGLLNVASNTYQHVNRPITRNFIESSTIILGLNAKAQFTRNTMICPSYSSSAGIYLYSASSTSISTPSPSPVVFHCRNSMPWATQNPSAAQLFSPALAARAKAFGGCSESVTLSLTPRLTDSKILLRTRTLAKSSTYTITATSTTSKSLGRSLSVLYSVSHTEALSMTERVAQTATESHTNISVPSASTALSISITLGFSITAHPSISHSILETASIAAAASATLAENATLTERVTYSQNTETPSFTTSLTTDDSLTQHFKNETITRVPTLTIRNVTNTIPLSETVIITLSIDEPHTNSLPLSSSLELSNSFQHQQNKTVTYVRSKTLNQPQSPTIVDTATISKEKPKIKTMTIEGVPSRSLLSSQSPSHSTSKVSSKSIAPFLTQSKIIQKSSTINETSNDLAPQQDDEDDTEATTINHGTVAVIAVLGAGAVSDVQTSSVVKMSKCKGTSAEAKKALYRSLSPVAIEENCEGVLIGNALLIAGLFALSSLATVLAKAFMPSHPSWISAMALVRGPSVVLVAVCFTLNSAAVCGAEYVHGGSAVWAGALLWVWCVAVVAALPLLAFLLGTRRYTAVEYATGQPLRLLSAVFLPQGHFDVRPDGSEEVFRCPPMLLAAVVGPYRHPFAGLAVTSVLSAIASWPCLLPPAGSRVCAGMYWLSAALHFVFSLFVFGLRPRRLLLSDVCHGTSLLLNGVLVAMTAHQWDTHQPANEQTLASISYAIAALAIVRVLQTLCLPIYFYCKSNLIRLNFDSASRWTYYGRLWDGKLKQMALNNTGFVPDLDIIQEEGAATFNIGLNRPLIVAEELVELEEEGIDMARPFVAPRKPLLELSLSSDDDIPPPRPEKKGTKPTVVFVPPKTNAQLQKGALSNQQRAYPQTTAPTKGIAAPASKLNTKAPAPGISPKKMQTRPPVTTKKPLLAQFSSTESSTADSLDSIV